MVYLYTNENASNISNREQNECKAAEAKLRTADTQRLKLQQTIPKEKLERSKKYRLIEKEMLKVCKAFYF